jgi:hypothetical protein
MPDAAAGRFACSYTAMLPGMYRLQLTAANPDKDGARVHITGSPHSIQVLDSSAGCDSCAVREQTAAGLCHCNPCGGQTYGRPTANWVPGVQVRVQTQTAEKQPQVATNDTEAAGGAASPAGSLQDHLALPPPPEQEQPILDRSQLWADIAAASFGADGVMDGWDSDNEQPQSSESKYLRVRLWHMSNWADAASMSCSEQTSSDGRHTNRDSALQAHPNVPVVENLEDLWLVSKLQRERKAKEQAAKQQRLVQLQVCCNVCVPPVHMLG